MQAFIDEFRFFVQWCFFPVADDVIFLKDTQIALSSYGRVRFESSMIFHSPAFFLLFARCVYWVLCLVVYFLSYFWLFCYRGCLWLFICLSLDWNNKLSTTTTTPWTTKRLWDNRLNNTETYLGLTENDFKTWLAKHKQNFKKEKQRYNTYALL